MFRIPVWAPRRQRWAAPVVVVALLAASFTSPFVAPMQADDPPPPGTPTVSATGGAASAIVSYWAEGIVATYLVTADPGGKTCSTDGSNSTCAVIGLTAGTSYTFTVTASNPWGTSPASDPSNAVVPTAAPSVSAGQSHSCAVAVSGTLTCWGDNLYGETNAPAGTYIAVSAGGQFSCAIRTDGTLACWGTNGSGQATPPAGTYIAVSAGGAHACAIATDGTLACWGYSADGRTTPPAGTYTAVSAGGGHTCAIATDGTLACWGWNVVGQATPPSGTYSNVSASYLQSCAVATDGTAICWGSTSTPPSDSYKAVSAGRDYGCAIKADGMLVCWGAYGQPQSTPPSGTYTSLSTGDYHACAVKTNGTLACWGFNSDGKATPPTAPDAPTDVTATAGPASAIVSWTAPADDGGSAITGYSVTSSPGGRTCSTSGALTCPFVGLTIGVSYTFTVTATNPWGTSPSAASNAAVPTAAPAVSAGQNHTCVMGASGTLTCWGYNVLGQTNAPAGTYKAVSAGYYHNCAIKTDGTLACWAYNGNGASTPPAGTYTVVAAGELYACAIKTDGTLACWGTNGSGQATPPPGTYTAISTGHLHSCAIKTDGTLACWGDNTHGQATPPAGTYTAITVDGSHSCAIATDGTLACWGYSADGRTSPPAGTYVALDAGTIHTCAINTDGTLACWGAGGLGQTTPPAGTFASISSGWYYSCAIRIDHAVVCWGDNSNNKATPPSAPGAPTGATATPGDGSATVSWTAPASNGGLTITGYTVTSDPEGATCAWTTGPLSCTVGGLTNGTAYTFTVVATNAMGPGAASSPSNSVTPATVPDAPTDATAVRGNASATVSWAAPASDGGSAITGYTVTSEPEGLTCAWTTGPLSCSVGGLTVGTSYTFTVTATNDVGTGLASDPSDAITAVAVPGAPTGVAATRGNGSATVSWTAPADDGGSAITGYTVTSDPEGLTCSPIGVGTTCTVGSLTNGAPYTFTVTATNELGTGAASDPSNSVTPATLPGAPTGAAAVRGNASATVSWAAPASDGGSAITLYTVTSDPEGLTCAWTTGPLTCTVTGLTVGTVYTFTVTAANDIGTGPASDPSNAITAAAVPGAPTDVTATRGNHSATVYWVAPIDDGGSAVTGYTVTASPGGLTCSPVGVGTSCTVSGLTNGTAYTFTVAAANDVGTGSPSDPSNSVTPATVPGAPTGVTATAGNGSATVSWTAPAANGSPITGYTVTSTPGGLTCTRTSGPTSCTVSGLTNGTWYTFRVTATNDVGTGPASDASDPVIPQAAIVRYGSNDIFATAAAVSANTFPSPCHCTVYIAYAYNFPDALAGAAAAGTVPGPVLFVATSGAINTSTAAELTRLAPDHIVALGSTVVISASVFDALKAYAPPGQTFRYFGTSRFDTAASVSSHTFAADCHCTAYVAYAMNFPDALAGAAAAGTVPGPVLLVATTGTINTATKNELLRLKPDHIVALGSTVVISASVFNALKAYAPTGQTFRYYGTSRFGTAASISSHTFAADCHCVVYISGANDFNGALAASSAAGTIKGPLLLVSTTGALDVNTTNELQRLKPVRIVVIGGTNQVSGPVYTALTTYAPTS